MVDEWVSAFGQIDAAQGLLSNAGVEPGDLFLFFGWFRQVEYGTNGFRFRKRNNGDFYSWADIHVIYGYMQVGALENIHGTHMHQQGAFKTKQMLFTFPQNIYLGIQMSVVMEH